MITRREAKWTIAARRKRASKKLFPSMERAIKIQNQYRRSSHSSRGEVAAWQITDSRSSLHGAFPRGHPSVAYRHVARWYSGGTVLAFPACLLSHRHLAEYSLEHIEYTMKARACQQDFFVFLKYSAIIHNIPKLSTRHRILIIPLTVTSFKIQNSSNRHPSFTFHEKAIK